MSGHSYGSFFERSMRLMLLALVLAGGCAEPLVDAAPTPADPASIAIPDAVKATATAFVNVRVVPMDTERVLENQTVLVQDGRIVEIGPVGSVALPDSVTRIDGQGAYLMPGLADMHVHVTSQDAMLLYLANGVTTIRVMWGRPAILQRRADVAAGAMTGPAIYTAGPGLEGASVYWPGTIQLRSAEEARATIRSIKAEGYDFIKTYNSLSQPVYDAILDEAQQVGLPVIGHVPRAVSLSHALEAGHHSIAHLLGYAPLVTTGGSWSSSLDENKARTLAAATRTAGAWNCPTFTVLSAAHTRPQIPAIKATAAWRYLSPGTQAWYDDPSTQPPSSRNPRSEENRKRFVKMLHEAGAGLLLGTDTGVQYVLPGVAVHEELQHLVEAGLTPYEALRTGTVHPAAFLGLAHEAGTVAVGRRADLLLLADNPLDDVAHVHTPLGVMVDGRWFSASRLQDMLDTLAASY